MAAARDERYVIISADAHAGLPCEEYRPYLDPRYTEQFDAFLAERQAMRDDQMKLNYDYITQWETTHEEGLRGAFDAEQRDKEMDADGVAAEVIFPDADSITGMESPPFGAGLSAGHHRRPRAGVRGGPRPQPVPRRSVRDKPGSTRRRRARADLSRHRRAPSPRSSGWPTSRVSAAS